MARFVVNTPISTREPAVTVDAGLAAGRHRFRLVVVDARGVRGLPHDAIVDVQRIVGRVGPTPLDPRRPVVEPVMPRRPVGPAVSPSRGPRRGRKEKA